MFKWPPPLGLALLLGLSPSLPGQEATYLRNDGDAVWYLVPGPGITSATFSTGPDRASQLDAPGVAWAPPERIPVPPHHVVKLVAGHLGSAQTALQVLDCHGQNPAGLSLTSEWWQGSREGEPVRTNGLQAAHPEHPMARAWVAALGTWTAPDLFTFSLDQFLEEAPGRVPPPPPGHPARVPVPEPATAAHAQPQAGPEAGVLDPEPPAAATSRIGTLEPVTCGPLRIEPRSGLVTLNGRGGHLAPQLASLLAILARRPGDVVSAQELLGLPQAPDRAAKHRLTLWITQLRSCLGQLLDLNPHQLLVTQHGQGYQLQVEALGPVTEHPARLPVPDPPPAAAHPQSRTGVEPTAPAPEPPMAAAGGDEALEPVVAGPMRIEPHTGQVTLNGRSGHLTPRLANLLAVLARRPGDIVSYQDLLGLPQVSASDAQLRLKDLIYNLRQRLEELFDLDPRQLLVNVPGRGYRLQVESLATPAAVAQETVICGPLRIKPHTGQVTLNGRSGLLAPQLVNLLATLARRPGDPVSYQELLGLPQTPGHDALLQLRARISDLRSRLRELFDLDPWRILVPIPGQGFRLQVEALGAPGGEALEPATQHPTLLPVPAPRSASAAAAAPAHAQAPAASGPRGLDPEPAAAAAAGDETLEPVIAGPLRIDPRSGQITLNGRSRHLAPRLANLLAILARRPGHVVPYRQLIGLRQAPDRHAQTRLANQVSALRSRLEGLLGLDPHRLLVRVPGRGYRLQIETLGVEAAGPATEEDGPPEPKRPRLAPPAAAAAGSEPAAHPRLDVLVQSAAAAPRPLQPSEPPRAAPPALTLGNHTPWALGIALSEMEGTGQLTLATPGHPGLASQVHAPGSGPYLLLPGAEASLNLPDSAGTFRVKFTMRDPSDPSRQAAFTWFFQPGQGPGLALTSPATGLSLVTAGSHAVRILPELNP